MNFRPLIRESLQIISFVCLNPFSNNLKNRIYGKCSVAIAISALIDVCLELILNYQGIDSTMEVLILVALAQIIMKMLFLLERKDDIILLVNNTNMFWKSKFDDCDQREKNNKIFLFVKFCIRSYISLLLIICFFYFIKPFVLAEEGELPWKSCCSQFLKYKFCFAIELLQSAILVSMQVGFDTLFVSLVTNIICEYKLVENCFLKLKINPAVRGTDNEVMDELKILIDHHNLILSCIKIMKQVYSGPFLGQFLSNMFGMCFSLIIITSNASNSAMKLLFGMVTIFYLIQLFFYCICGSLIADESVQISAQVYNSKWWIKTQPELRKALIMVILRANKPEILTAGGLLQVNLQTFTTILRSTISFFTFMQVIYGNTE